MKEVARFFENLNEIVYISDMDTHELVYLNKKGRTVYGFHSEDEYKGRKCYEVLQNASTPCCFCTNRELREGYFKEWKYYNPSISRHFLLKDTMRISGGRRYRVEMAIDISSQEEQRHALDNYQRLEEIVNAGLRLALMARTPDGSLNILLEYIGKALHADRTFIFERNSKGNDDNTYEWVAAGVSSEIDTLQDVPAEVCAQWYATFTRDKLVVLKQLEDIRESDPLQYATLKRQNINSLVVIPLYENDVPIGFYGVDNPPAHLLNYSAEMLQIMGHIILSLLKMRKLIDKLRDMSRHDPLTNFGNRYALDEYAASLDGPDALGVVFCDITGLKEMNDTQGHNAGDALILRACDCMKTVFSGYDLFRIGGDEFLVFCRGVRRAELDDKVLYLKTLLQESDVVMAVGSVWYKPCSSADIDKLMSEAEVVMYKEKAAYYKESGRERRRR